MASLTLAEAEVILAGAKAKVVELGLKMSISVVDPRGDLITMFKMDGAPWRTPAVASRKGQRELTESGGVGQFRKGQRRVDRQRSGAHLQGFHGHGRRTYDPRPGRVGCLQEWRDRRRGRRQRRHGPRGRGLQPGGHQCRWFLRETVSIQRVTQAVGARSP